MGGLPVFPIALLIGTLIGVVLMAGAGLDEMWGFSLIAAITVVGVLIDAARGRFR
ncbi:MAG: hypothetical protein ACM31L_01925 [Actinomycetota bacterium]